MHLRQGRLRRVARHFARGAQLVLGPAHAGAEREPERVAVRPHAPPNRKPQRESIAIAERKPKHDPVHVAKHVALGVDFFPTDGAWYDLQAAQGTTNLQWAVDDMSGMPRITEALAARGYSEEDIRAVLGGNFLRVCEATFGS